MAYTFKDINIQDAVLTNGARIATLEMFDSVLLEDRFTVAQDIVVTNVIADHNGIVADPDSLHFWTTRRSENAVKKIRISDGAVVANITTGISTPEAINTDGVSIFVACAGGNNIKQIDPSTATVTATYTSPTASPYHFVKTRNLADKGWVRTGNSTSGTYTEFTLSTGVATGRTLGAGAAYHLVSTEESGTRYLYWTGGGNVLKLLESDLSLVRTFTRKGGNLTLPGHGAFRELYVDSQFRPNVRNTNTGAIDRWLSGSDTFDKRIFDSEGHLGGGTLVAGGVRFLRDFIAFTPDGKYVAYAHVADPTTENFTAIRIRNVQTQRARLSFANPVKAAITIKAIITKGDLGNARGFFYNPPNTYPTGYDLRKVRTYYSVDGGSNRFEYEGNLDGLTIPVGGTLTLDWDFNTWEKPSGPHPWVSGLSGPVIRVWYDDPTIVLVPPAMTPRDDYRFDLTAAYLQSAGWYPLVAGDDWTMRFQARDAAGALSLLGATITMKVTDDEVGTTVLATRQTGTLISGGVDYQIEPDANQSAEDIVAKTGKGWFTVRFGSETADKDALIAAVGSRFYEIRARLTGDVVKVLFRGKLEILKPRVNPMP